MTSGINDHKTVTGCIASLGAAAGDGDCMGCRFSRCATYQGAGAATWRWPELPSTRALQKEFERVRETFFPRWDRKREWKVEYTAEPLAVTAEDHPYFIAYCAHSTKTITVLCSECLVGNQLKVVLIHEVCHAIAFKAFGLLGHGDFWRHRMQAIAEKAARLRMLEVAEDISNDVRVWKDLNTLLAWTRYELIERVARETEDDFSAVIDRVISVAYEDPEGVYKPGGRPRNRFLRRYPLAKEAYEKGKSARATVA
jgi:hypothetical protein